MYSRDESSKKTCCAIVLLRGAQLPVVFFVFSASSNIQEFINYINFVTTKKTPLHPIAKNVCFWISHVLSFSNHSSINMPSSFRFWTPKIGVWDHQIQLLSNLFHVQTKTLVGKAEIPGTSCWEKQLSFLIFWDAFGSNSAQRSCYLQKQSKAVRIKSAAL